MSDLVIADTSCLIVLTKIKRLELLKDIFGSISITEEVKEEFGEKLPEWIKVKSISIQNTQNILALNLDLGEASAIALALENTQSLLLIDERKARNIAKSLSLKVMGTLGVLIKAKEKNIVISLKEEIIKLQKVDFRMSTVLMQKILEKYD